MTDIFVGRLMSSPVRTISPETSIQEAARLMSEHRIGSVIVVDGDDGLEGILTATDFVRLGADGRPAAETAVSEYMSTDVVTCEANDGIREIADLMIDQGFHHVPVVDGTEGVVGIVTTTDLTAYLSHAETPSPD
jgi:CBS domain-containing protein